MKASVLSYIVITSVLAGCANVNSIARRTTFKSDKKENTTEIKAIHLDAKQRLAYMSDFGTLCAEPSPDALSAFASSLGTSIVSKSGDTANASASAAESAASIGLRTQSIQLMRDAMYRVCEGYNAKALDGLAVMQLHLGFQDIMVGLMAIEQLTGATVAQQGALGTTATGSASNAAKKAEELVSDITKKIEAQQKAIDEANKLKGAADSTLATRQTEHAELLEDTKVTPEAIQSSESQLLTAQQASSVATKTVEYETKILETLQQQKANVEQYAGQIAQLATTAATAAAQLSSGNAGKPLSDASINKMTDAVTSIAEKIIDENNESAACLATVSRFAKKVYDIADNPNATNQQIGAATDTFQRFSSLCAAWSGIRASKSGFKWNPDTTSFIAQ